MPGASQTAADSAYCRSDKYYYEVVVFEVEGTLYRGFKESFLKWSQSVFRDMFSMPQNPDTNALPREGDSDANPIRVVGCTKAEFESLLELMNPSDGPGVPKLSKEQWVGVLRLARLWDMPKAARLAIERLDTFNLTPVDQVQLGKAHGVPEWLKSGYRALIGHLSEDTSFEELAILGFETFSRILWAREKIRNVVDATQRSEEADRIWVDNSYLCCCHCWKTYSIKKPITVGATRCGACTLLYSNMEAVLINQSYTSLKTSGPNLFLPIQKDPVTEKVEEMFGEEIEDAERRNTSAGV